MDHHNHVGPVVASPRKFLLPKSWTGSNAILRMFRRERRGFGKIASMQSVSPPLARHALMDASRGFAILGILWLNIFIFAIPYGALALPGTWGDTDPLSYSLNVETWRFVGLFVDGVMRGMISMLFGASALIMMAKAERAGVGLAGLDPYYRRLLWLIVFGLVHAYLLLWPYDILYLYGLFGLLLFPFRNLSSRTLTIIASVMLTASVIQGAAETYLSADVPDTVAEAEISKPLQTVSLIENFVADDTAGPAAQDQAETDTPADEDFQQLISGIEQEIAARQGGYVDNLLALAPQSFVEQTSEVFAHHFLDVITFMAFGMALFKSGFLTGAWPARRYGMVVVTGYWAGWVLGYLSNTVFETGSTVETVADVVSSIAYDPRRFAFALGHLSLLALALKAGRARWLTFSLEACGRLALTLYISQSVICGFLFDGFGLSLFGTLEHYQVALIAAAMTIFQLVAAPLYLRFFEQGPLERLIRWLITAAPLPEVTAAPPRAGAKA